MKNTLITFAVAAGFGALGCLTPQTSSGQENRFYVKPDVGANWTLDTDLDEFVGAESPGSEVEFDPGLRIGLAGGYQVTKWFSAEGEVGMMANNIHSITDADRVDAWFANVPFLVNARFQYPNSSRFTPYIGAGVGVSTVILDADNIDINGARLHGSDADAVFAYQGFAGLRFSLNDNMGLSLEYRYFGAESPSWEADLDFGAGSDEVRFGRTKTHVVSLAFEWSF